MKLKNDLTIFALGAVLLFGACAALQVTPADRQAAYQREGQAGSLACKAYKFDLSLGLTNEAPAMTELCKASNEGAK